MSGHSKWHKVRQYKGAIDAKRAGIFTKLGRNITVAARLGGGDPTMNFSLRMAIEKAKSANMPKENIDKAVKRGTGELEGGIITEAVYEGFGPGKVGLVIVSQTDNTNRALTEIKTMLNKNGGEFAAQGSVAWNFDKKGVVYLAEQDLADTQQEEVDLELIDAGATDIIREDGSIIIMSEVADFGTLLKKIEEWGVLPRDSGLEYVAKTKKQLSAEDEEKLHKLLEILDDHDDVDSVFHEAA